MVITSIRTTCVRASIIRKIQRRNQSIINILVVYLIELLPGFSSQAFMLKCTINYKTIRQLFRSLYRFREVCPQPIITFHPLRWIREVIDDHCVVLFQPVHGLLSCG